MSESNELDASASQSNEHGRTARRNRGNEFDASANHPDSDSGDQLDSNAEEEHSGDGSLSESKGSQSDDAGGSEPAEDPEAESNNDNTEGDEEPESRRKRRGQRARRNFGDSESNRRRMLRPIHALEKLIEI